MLNAFGYLSCFKLCQYNWPGPNFWAIVFSIIMLNAFGYLSCFQLCRHNWPGPILQCSRPLDKTLIHKYSLIHLFVIKMSWSVDTKWSLHYQSYNYKNSCIILSNIPPVIYSENALLILLSKIDGAHVCKGDQPTVCHVNYKVLISDNVCCEICALHWRSLSLQVAQHSKSMLHWKDIPITIICILVNFKLSYLCIRNARRNMQKRLVHLKAYYSKPERSFIRCWS